MPNDGKAWFAKGLRDGLPISMGYFAVAFTLGIAAKNAGLTAFQATLTSLLINASAGEFAGFTLISAGASLLEMAAMMLVVNARYLLMSCALSQKLGSQTSLLHRMLIGFDVTDEIFGVSISAPGKLNPFYPFGMMAVSIPGWASGTCPERWTLWNVSRGHYSPRPQKPGHRGIDRRFHGAELPFFQAPLPQPHLLRNADHSAHRPDCRSGRGAFSGS